MTSTNAKLSLIICTFNRANYLKELLKSIEAQPASDLEYEVIIVNNNSTDQTEELSKNYCARNSNWHYFFEVNQGNLYARNRGWQEANNDYLIYLDDECILPVGYLNIAFQIILNYVPDFFGGPIYPKFNFMKPLWLKDEYFSHNIGIERGYVIGKYLAGGNMGVKRSVLQKTNGFNVIFAVNGKKIDNGGDTYIQICAQRNNDSLKTYFEPNLWVYHQVLPHKMGVSYSINRSFLAGKTYPKLTFATSSDSWIYKKNLFIQLKKYLRLFFQVLILGKNILACAFRNRSEYLYWQNFYFEKIKIEIFRLGYYFGILFDDLENNLDR